MNVKQVVEPFEAGSAGEAGVRGHLHRPAPDTGDGLVITHGAGSNCESPLLKAMAEAFCGAGWTVLRCDLPFRQLRPKGPPRGSAELDQLGLKHAVEALKKIAAGRVFLSGHSYGGRQASMLAASEPGLVEGLLLLSYPLHPPKQPKQLRTAHFPSLRTPALFVHGTLDGFGSIEELRQAAKLIPAQTYLLVAQGAGHELLNAKNRQELPVAIVKEFAAFIARAGKSSERY